MRKIPTKWTRLQNQNSTLSSSAKIVHHKSRNGNIREKKLSLLTRPRAAGKKWKMSRDIFFVSVHISHSLSVSPIATSFTSANNTQPLSRYFPVCPVSHIASLLHSPPSQPTHQCPTFIFCRFHADWKIIQKKTGVLILVVLSPQNFPHTTRNSMGCWRRPKGKVEKKERVVK